LLFAMALNSESDESVDELRVGKAGGFPEFGVHADAGEAGHGVDFVEVNAGGFGFFAFLWLAGGLHEEVDAGEPGAVTGAEGGDGHVADLFCFGL